MKLPVLFLLPCILFSVHSVAEGPKRPKIIGQFPLSTNEDQAITLQLLNLIVEDPDDFYPLGFTMTVLPGNDYTFDNSTVTPAANYNGILSVNVTVNDGNRDSQVYGVQITVNPVNDAPLIKGQVALSTIEEVPLTLSLANLTVEDPDNAYPTGFSLTVNSGSNYKVSGTTITPALGFSGTLTVPVTVSDGSARSPVYNLQVTVIPDNKTPVITGQVAITTAKNQAFSVDLQDLQVNDPDSKYPDEFKLNIYAGTNYTFSGSTVTPATNFIGTLSVNVTVNDGNSNSAVFPVKVEVKDKLVIIGQDPAESDEDATFTITLDMLTVYDPENKFPTGYSLQVQAGDNYTATGSNIVPARNFNGILAIAVRISNGSVTSDTYSFDLKVLPVNDPPEVIDFSEQPVKFTIGGGAKNVYSDLNVADPDDTSMILAEVGFSSGYQPGNDVLILPAQATITSVFDNERGILSLFGLSPIADYKLALENITYDYVNLESPVPQNKTIYLKLSDGKSVSILYEKEIVPGEDFELDIPTVFTPNEDLANDTWKIKPYRASERYSNTIVRVFNDRGVLVFESVGFDREWDGRFGGQPVPAGSYLYVVDLNLNYDTKRLTGSVSILR